MTTQYNDDLVSQLRDKGFTGPLNDMLVAHYEANGYVGSLNDMAKQVRDALSSSEMFPIIPAA